VKVPAKLAKVKDAKIVANTLSTLQSKAPAVFNAIKTAVNNKYVGLAAK